MRIPLVFDPQSRDASTSKDAILVNCMTQRYGRQLRPIKRPGTAVLSTDTSTPTDANGCFSWSTSAGQFAYFVRGTTLIQLESGGTPFETVLGTVTNENYWFAESGGASPLTVAVGASDAFTISPSGTVTSITSGGFPATRVPGVAVLDGYTIVADSSGKLYNSAIDDPLTWTGDFVTAEFTPDITQAIAKHVNYVAVFGSRSTEFFYDAANLNGSPLGPLTGSELNVGCLSGTSVASTGDTACWLARDEGGSAFVAALHNTQVQKISTDAVDLLLATTPINLASFRGFFLRTGGHLMYCLTASGITLVYDFEVKLWYQWVSGGSSNFTFSFSCSSFDTALGTLLQSSADGQIYLADVSLYSDNATAIDSQIITPIFDGDSTKAKFLSRLQVIGDQVTSSTVTVSASDDDYQTWKTLGTVDMSQKRPQLFQCGRFRRRAFRLDHSAKTAMRFESLELDVHEGMR